MKLSLVQLKAKHFDLSREIEKARSVLESLNNNRDQVEAEISAAEMSDQKPAKTPSEEYSDAMNADSARPAALPAKRKPGRPRGASKPAREPEPAEPAEPALANGQP